MAAPNPFLIENLSPLYEDIQLSGIFPDSKYFVDALPLRSTEIILADYLKRKGEAGFNLKGFVIEYFKLPEESTIEYSSANKTITENLNGLWDVLTRMPEDQSGTLLPLPYSYIVPGGRFREVYYWDSYFTMLGLQVSGRVDIIQNIVDNFAYLIHQVGFVPNGNRSYYLGRSQPPFFALMVNILAEEKGETVWTKYLPALEKEYAFWMDGSEHINETENSFRRIVRMPNGALLNRYWDDQNTPRPEAYIEDLHLADRSGRNKENVYRHIRAAAESGWDFSSRWFVDPNNMATIRTADLIPVDLNCLLLYLERTLHEQYVRTSNPKESVLQEQIIKREKGIQQYCWNETEQFFYDYAFLEQQTTNNQTLAACFPLFFQVASKEQANKVVDKVTTQFLHSGGLSTTLNHTGQQWDAPNGWAPLQWIAYKGFMNYGFEHHAEQIRNNWMHTNENVFAATGKMMEKYNVTDTDTKAGGGEYPNQDGFGWTNGVYLKFLSLGNK
jgi:alpha,alpha-trehalase